MDLLEWSKFRRYGQCSSNQKILTANPRNLFQLHFWCQLVALAKIKEDDVPESAVFYLHDKLYETFTCHLQPVEKSSILFKIQLISHILGMSGNINTELVQGIQSSIAINKSIPAVSTQQLIQNFIKSHTKFVSSQALNIVSNYLKVQEFQQGKNKPLAALDDLSTSSIIVERLFSDSQEDSILKQFLISNKKTKVCELLREHLLKSKKGRLVELWLEVVNKLSVQNEMITYHFNTYCEDLYAVYFKEEGNLSKFPYFERFMLKHSAIRCLVLHRQLNVQVASEQMNGDIGYLLSKNRTQIFTAILKSPLKSCNLCLEKYLQWSQFAIPSARNKGKNKKQQLIYSPIAFISICKQYWGDQFHRNVLNLCLWVLLQHWLLKVNSLKPEQSEYEQYKKNYGLALIHLIAEYPLGSFMDYYPIQRNLISQLIFLPSYSEIMLKNSEFLQIPWFPNTVHSGLKAILKQSRGYQLVYETIVSSSIYIDQQFGQLLLDFIQLQIHNPREKDCRIYISKILEHLSNSKIFEDRCKMLMKQM